VLLLVGCVGCLGVPVPYALCSIPSAHLKISSVSSNEWPPKKGDTLNITVTGVVDETVTSGQYSINIKIDGFPLPAITGDISTFHPLPWAKGPLQFSFLEDIPGDAPSGSYALQISAVDQSNQQLFCVDLAFKLIEAVEEAPITPTTGITRHGVRHQPKPDTLDSTVSPLTSPLPPPLPTSKPAVHPPSPIFARRTPFARNFNKN